MDPRNVPKHLPSITQVNEMLITQVLKEEKELISYNHIMIY